jgi:hypothetical protein
MQEFDIVVPLRETFELNRASSDWLDQTSDQKTEYKSKDVLAAACTAMRLLGNFRIPGNIFHPTDGEWYPADSDNLDNPSVLCNRNIIVKIFRESLYDSILEEDYLLAEKIIEHWSHLLLTVLGGSATAFEKNVFKFVTNETFVEEGEATFGFIAILPYRYYEDFDHNLRQERLSPYFDSSKGLEGLSITDHPVTVIGYELAGMVTVDNDGNIIIIEKTHHPRLDINTKLKVTGTINKTYYNKKYRYTETFVGLGLIKPEIDFLFSKITY